MGSHLFDGLSVTVIVCTILGAWASCAIWRAKTDPDELENEAIRARWLAKACYWGALVLIMSTRGDVGCGFQLTCGLSVTAYAYHWACLTIVELVRS